MTANDSETLVSVFSSPLPYEADVVKAMLADEDIPSTVQNDNGPFPGLTSNPSTVYVASEYEAKARQLIEVHEAEHLQRVAKEENEEAAVEEFGEEMAEAEDTDD